MYRDTNYTPIHRSSNSKSAPSTSLKLAVFFVEEKTATSNPEKMVSPTKLKKLAVNHSSKVKFKFFTIEEGLTSLKSIFTKEMQEELQITLSDRLVFLPTCDREDFSYDEMKFLLEPSKELEKCRFLVVQVENEGMLSFVLLLVQQRIDFSIATSLITTFLNSC